MKPWVHPWKSDTSPSGSAKGQKCNSVQRPECPGAASILVVSGIGSGHTMMGHFRDSRSRRGGAAVQADEPGGRPCRRTRRPPPPVAPVIQYLSCWQHAQQRRIQSGYARRPDCARSCHARRRRSGRDGSGRVGRAAGRQPGCQRAPVCHPGDRSGHPWARTPDRSTYIISIVIIPACPCRAFVAALQHADFALAPSGNGRYSMCGSDLALCRKRVPHHGPL